MPLPDIRRATISALKLAIVVAVGWGVSGTVTKAITQLSRQEWHVAPFWLILAGMLYLVGLSAQGWFWHHALASLGQQVPWLATFRAYFLGHLGKYVPGKALVVILRVAGVKRWVPSLRVAVISTLLETLTMMAVGAFLAALLTLIFLDVPPVLMLLAGAMAVASGIPTLPPVARWLAQLGAMRANREQTVADLEPLPPRTSGAAAAPSASSLDASLSGISPTLLASGWIAAAVCWLFLGLSLWATLRSLGLEQFRPLDDMPLLVAASSLAVVAGFLSLMPGGLLVRDAVLMQLLAPICGDADALVATILLRLVWLATEAVMCGILEVAARCATVESPS